jgi:hypothetical protein
MQAPACYSAEYNSPVLHGEDKDIEGGKRGHSSILIPVPLKSAGALAAGIAGSARTSHRRSPNAFPPVVRLRRVRA